MEVKTMKGEINYPKLKKEVNKFLIFRKIMLIILVLIKLQKKKIKI